VGGPSPVRYLYRLEGYDENWRETDNRSASYSGLPDGSYVFCVRARDTGGESGTATYSILIDTTPPTIELFIPGISLTETETGWTCESQTGVINLRGWLELGSRLTINGRPIPVSAGYFNTTLTLSSGLNIFRIRITDPAGNITEKILMVNYPVAAPATPPTEYGPMLITVLVIVLMAVVVLLLKRP
jgi:hypothetical protein